MRKSRLGIVFAGVAAMGIAAATYAQEQSDWLTARQREFSTWQAAHPNVEAQLPALKAKTAALIAAHVAEKAGEKYSDLKTQSAQLSPAQRAKAEGYFASGRQFYEMGDYFSAKEFLDMGLAIDPANVPAIFHRGDIYRRDADRMTDPYLRDGYRANAALYMDRVLSLRAGSAQAQQADEAMRYLEKITEEPEVNRPFVIWKVTEAPGELWDAPYAPQMVIIPAGEYTMGSLASEKFEFARSDTENPRHRVRIAYPLAVGKYNVTRAEFAYFLKDSGYDITKTVCNILGMGPGGSWDKPGFPQTDNDPVACMSQDNANAYAAWLSKKTGHTYRLLSEAEWEYAARGGTTTAYYWGNDIGKGNANCPGCGSPWDLKSTSPVGSFPPNPFGLYDMSGNIWQIVADCFNYSYAGAPRDGSAWRAGNCNNSLERSGSFNQATSGARSAGNRGGRGDAKDRGLNIHGFRVARVL